MVYDMVYYNNIGGISMEYDKIFAAGEYYAVKDLRYNESLGMKLSSAEIEELFDYKDKLVSEGLDGFFDTKLYPFNSKYIFYNKHNELVRMYEEYIDLINSNDIFSDREEIVRARIYSEVEGSLKIEGFDSTRKLFDRLMAGKKPENRNETIIQNMGKGINFVESSPIFNAGNLHELYTILSDGCLDEDQKLKSGALYRDDMVYISTYNGCRVEEIADSMNSLFTFVNSNLRTEDPFLRFMMPHIVHYYIVYIHPYFDYNGRTARMSSLWIAKLLGLDSAPFFISEAINDTKKQYYNAISMTRDSRNDLTYFLKYILQTSLKYGLCYLQIRETGDRLADRGERMTPTEEAYFKKILLASRYKRFSWKDFTGYINTDISKQGALKALNKLEELGILGSTNNSRGEKQFFVI